jgi:hypothetical protein
MRRDGLFVFVVNLDPEELLNLFGRPHFDGIPRHALANVDAYLATDTFVESNLDIWNHDIHAVGRISWSVFDAVDGTEGNARFTACTVVGNNDCEFLRLLFLPSNLGRGFGNDQSRIRFLGIVCHGLVHS